MGTTISPSQYKINGVIDTTKTVLSNIEQIAGCAGAWTTYNTSTGKWSWVINKTESSTRAFNDNNIIGSISLSGKSVTEYYNRVSISHPRDDLVNKTDYAYYALDPSLMHTNEVNNEMSLNYPLVTDPVQAHQLGMLELKQSRISESITFYTDYTNIDLNAGDVIDITNNTFNWSAQKFRIMQIEEVDNEGIQIKIDALMYDPSTYDTSDLHREEREIGTSFSSPSPTEYTGNPMYSATAGKVTINDLPQTSGSFSLMHTEIFTPAQSGLYMINCIIDQNTSGARGGRGVDWGEPSDSISVSFDLRESDGSTVIANSSSGNEGAFWWTDYAITDNVNLVQGNTYRLHFFYRQETESSPTATASFDISWNVFTIGT